MNKSNIHTNLIGILKTLTVLFLLFVNIVVTIALFAVFNDAAKYLDNFFIIITLFFVAKIILSSKKSNYKISWIIFLLLFPVVGLLFYLFYGRIHFNKKFKNQYFQMEEYGNQFIKQEPSILDELKEKDIDMFQQVELIRRDSSYPVNKNTEVTYLPIGEDYFNAMLEELKKAEKFIFMQYFIVSDGRMHQTLMDVLIEKSKAGVEVYYVYDVFGSIFSLPKHFRDRCKEHNINLLPFNENFISLYHFISYRDHRKITVVDGKVGFTGGINIGDEYINEVVRFGHWKDMGVMLKGDAVNSLSVIFLKSWGLFKNETIDFTKYINFENDIVNDTYVSSFDDGPIAKDVAEKNYLRMIASAKDYVYICTPYLIISEEMISAIDLACSSNVDVRILTPHIPDKKVVFQLTRSFYGPLLEKGAKIFEYEPGFVHGKTMVVDDKVAFVGTINLDYRSLLWNFECGSWIYDKTFASTVKDDYLKTLDISVEYTLEQHLHKNIVRHYFDAFLQIIAPLI
ncbi:MAG: cardiolipin synthase [Lachnospirales bacterium]